VRTWIAEKSFKKRKSVETEKLFFVLPFLSTQNKTFLGKRKLRTKFAFSRKDTHSRFVFLSLFAKKTDSNFASFRWGKLQ
jgi:hypothetical protein